MQCSRSSWPSRSSVSKGAGKERGRRARGEAEQASKGGSRAGEEGRKQGSEAGEGPIIAGLIDKTGPIDKALGGGEWVPAPCECAGITRTCRCYMIGAVIAPIGHLGNVWCELTHDFLHCGGSRAIHSGELCESTPRLPSLSSPSPSLTYYILTTFFYLLFRSMCVQMHLHSFGRIPVCLDAFSRI